jgi:hypothetical protein
MIGSAPRLKDIKHLQRLLNSDRCRADTNRRRSNPKLDCYKQGKTIAVGSICERTELGARLSITKLTAAMIAILLNPNFPDAEAQSKEVQSAAHTLGLQIEILRASIERDLDTAFAKLAELRSGGLLVCADPFLYSRRDYIVALAARHGRSGGL